MACNAQSSSSSLFGRLILLFLVTLGLLAPSAAAQKAKAAAYKKTYVSDMEAFIKEA